MTKRMLFSGSIVALLTAAPAFAEDLPVWQPATICAEDSAPDYCRFLETQARRDITEQWAFIPALVRRHCLSRMAEEGGESWRAMGDCLSDVASGDVEIDGAKTAQGASSATGDSSARIADLESELAAAREAQASLRAERDAAMAELEAAQAATSATDESAARIADLESELAVAGEAQSALRAERDAAMAELEAAQAEPAEPVRDGASEARIAELEAALAEASAAADRGQAQVNGLNALLGAFRQSRADRDAEIAGLRQSLLAGEGSADRIAELEAELEKSQTAARRNEVRIEGLQQRLAASLEAAEAAPVDEGALAALEAENAELKERISAIEADLAAQTAAAAAGSETTAQLAEAETALRRAEVRIEGLQSRLAEALEREAVADDGSALQAELEQARATISEGENRMAALQARLDEVLAAAEDAGGQQEEVARLERLLDNLRARSGRVGQTVAAQRERILALESELDTAQRELRANEAFIGAARAVQECQSRITDIASSGEITFELSSAELTAAARPVLDRLIDVALSCPDATIRIEGHTDSYGDPAFNNLLSEQRARSVADYMSARGINESRLVAIGRGASEPIASNETRAGRARNRRIEFVLR